MHARFCLLTVAALIEGIKSYACKKYSLHGWKDFWGYADVNPFRQWITAEIATVSRRRRGGGEGWFLDLCLFKSSKVRFKFYYVCMRSSLFYLHHQCVVILSNDLYCAKHKSCHVYEQFVQGFVESHPFCEVCEKILPKTQRSMVRILTYYNLHMCISVSYNELSLQCAF